MFRNDIDAEKVRSLLNYDPVTGVFEWRVSRGTAKAGRIAGRISNQGYVVIKIDSIHRQAHRLAWLHTHGKWPDGEIDHINGNRSDNRLSNLRDASKEQNQQNRNAPRADNKTGLQGVFKHRDCDRWVAQIMAKKKQIYLGLFKSPEEAHSAYLKAKSEMHSLGSSERVLPDF